MSDRDTGLESPRHDEAEPAFGDGACRAEGLKSAILHLAEQIAAADRRQSEALLTMQQKLTRLGSQTEAVKAALPVHLVAAFERIEAGMAQLADQLAQTDHPRSEQPISALPVETQTELAFVPADAAEPVGTVPQAHDANEIHPPHMEPASQQFDAPPPLKSAIGLQPPGTWGSREVVKPADPVFVQNPDEPWDAASAAELSRLYESGEAGIPPLRSALDEQPQPDVQQQHQSAVAAEPATDAVAHVAQAPMSSEPLPLTTLVSNHDAGVGSDWLDVRLNEMAARIEQSLVDLRPDTAIAALGERFDTFEAKLTSMLDGVASKSDVEGLRLIEAHISELGIQVEEARARLDRLDQIDRQLADLQATLTDEEILRKFGGIVPTEEDLVRFAEEAATRAASRVATGTPSHGGADPDTMRMFADIAQASQTAQSEANRQILAMQDVFARYMDERRRGEAQTAEALETLQHAMQHMLDRVDAIEMRSDYPAQMEPEPYAEPMREMPQPVAPRAEIEPTPEALQRSFAEQAKAAAARMSMQNPAADRPSVGQSPVADRGDPMVMHAAAGDHVTTRAIPQEPRPTAEAPIATAGPEKDETVPGKPQDRQAFIAMARRAAEQAKVEADRQAAAAGKPQGTAPPPAPGKNGKPVSGGKVGARPGILVAASLSAFLLAGFWFVSSPKFRSFNSGITFGKPAAPSKPVVPVEPAAKVPADPRAPAIDEEATPAKPEQQPQQIAPDNPAGQQKPRRSTPETGIDDLGHNLPKGPERKAAVDMPVENIGLGVAVEHGPHPLTPEDIIRARQKAHVAQLSQRTAQDAARIQVVPQDRLPNGIIEMAKVEQPEREQPAQPAERNTVELPPAAIGPMSLRLAAGKGDPSAQFDIAVRFAEGKGVRQDFAQAAVWYQRAATQGMPLAQYRLAGLLERGLGITADPAKARIWYKRAAEQGNVKAMHNLAVLNAGRNASPAEMAVALKWFGDAADRGLADSQFNLAVLLETGIGVEKDPVQAYKWYALAARSGDKEAARRRDQLKTRLEPEQLSTAEAAIAAWRSKPVDRMVNDPRAAGEAWKHTANVR